MCGLREAAAHEDGSCFTQLGMWSSHPEECSLTCLGGLVSQGSSLTVPQLPTLYHSHTFDTLMPWAPTWHSAASAVCKISQIYLAQFLLKWEERAAGALTVSQRVWLLRLFRLDRVTQQ